MNEAELKKGKQILYIAYICLVLSFFFIPLFIAGIILYIKRPELKGSIYFEHCSFAIRTFWLIIISLVISISQLAFSAMALVDSFSSQSISYSGFGFSLFISIIVWIVSILSIIRVIAGFIKLHGDREVNPKAWLIP